MKLDEKETLAVKQVIEQKAKQQQEYKKLGTYIKQVDGGKIYAFNPQTSELKLAEYKTELIFGQKPKRRLDVEPGWVYVEALNEKNAWKRLEKGKIIYAS